MYLYGGAVQTAYVIPTSTNRYYRFEL